MPEKITITTKNNEKLQIAPNTKYYEIVDKLNSKEVIAIRINGELMPLSTKVNNNDQVEFITTKSITGNKIYQAGIKFVLEVALKETFGPSYDAHFNHSITDGVHITIKCPQSFTIEDTEQLASSMHQIILADDKIERLNIDKQEAIDFYRHHNYEEKAQNIHNVTNNVVTLYRLHKYVNYFYVEMPYSTKYLNNFALQYLSENEIVLMIPSRQHASAVPPYIHYEKVIRNYKTTKYWLKNQQASYLAEVNYQVSNYQVRDLIKSSEMYFNIKVEKVAEEVIKRKAKFIMLAGPSSSGKTTTTKKLALILASLGYRPFMISVDDFFKERVDSPKKEDGTYDFESIEAIDTNLLSDTLKHLINGKSVKMPRFDFTTGQKVFDKVVKLPDNSIILMEGLHCLNDELTPSIPRELKYKVYLSPFIALKIDRHNYISSTDVRIIRRIVRDKMTRNRGVDVTIGYLDTLRLGEAKYIYPFINQADTIINTALPYEIGVLKVYAEPLLYSIDCTSPYYEEARRLINFLKGFFPIPSEYVNDDSILREFIGGSIFE